MITTTFTEADVRIRDAVMRELDWDPQVDASAVGVAAREGTVTLSGYVDSYSGKLAAERAAKRVFGVRAVANDVEVRPSLVCTDDVIAHDVGRALELRATIPSGVQATVVHGHVTLTGTVPWLFQKDDAAKAVRHVRGVRSVLNSIAVAPLAAGRDIRKRIVRALHQNADVDAHHIAVTVAGGTVTLSGTVDSWLERASAERAAANAPGVTEVRNQIAVEPSRAPAMHDLDEVC
jgi:osmotically-inducible protein OsmY